MTSLIDGSGTAGSADFSSMSSEEKVLYGMRKTLLKVDGVVYRKWKTAEGTSRMQLITPKELRQEIFRLAHQSRTGGHLGSRRMAASIRRRYFWPAMMRDIKQWVLSCDECASRSMQNLKRSPMQKYRVGAPMERVAMDVMGPLPKSTRGNRYILVIGDYFTKWVEAYPMPNQEAVTVADIFVNQFAARYGIPMEIHTDQGRNFESDLLRNVCRILGIHKTRTTAFRPQSDGFIERFNRTLQQILSLYVSERQTNWDQLVPLAMAAYRSTPQETTGQSPNLLMLGREVNTPVELLIGRPPGESTAEVTEYGSQLRERLEAVYKAVRAKSGREMERQKKLYDRRKVDNQFQPGDRVWMAVKTRKKGKAPKLQRKWSGPKLVLSRFTDVTYEIAESETRQKVVHFDLLKPYNGVKHPRWMKRRMADSWRQTEPPKQSSVPETEQTVSESDTDSE